MTSFLPRPLNLIWPVLRCPIDQKMYQLLTSRRSSLQLFCCSRHIKCDRTHHTRPMANWKAGNVTHQYDKKSNAVSLNDIIIFKEILEEKHFVTAQSLPQCTRSVFRKERNEWELFLPFHRDLWNVRWLLKVWHLGYSKKVASCVSLWWRLSQRWGGDIKLASVDLFILLHIKDNSAETLCGLFMPPAAIVTWFRLLCLCPVVHPVLSF